MKRFHSELTCGEVWYRLNSLLQRFAVWGPKRYEVRGELTEWGCYLWLRNPNGLGGTPVPLRLRTEEDREAGCGIVCSFLPVKPELWRLPATAGVFCLEIFLAELIRGGSFFPALWTGLCVGCAAALVFYTLRFGLVRLGFRKREKELLQWVQTYLLRRELDGVLLPDLETQKAEWVGLPQKAEPVRKRRFAFRCPLPPEKTFAALELWSSQQNLRQAGQEVKWSVKRRGNRVTLSRSELEEGRREGVQAGAGSLEYSSRWYKTWQYANPFCGTLEADGQGGSILRGAFVPHGWFLGLDLIFWAVLCCALYLSLPLRFALPLSLIAAVFCLIPIAKNPLKNPGSHKILEFLQTYLEEI